MHLLLPRAYYLLGMNGGGVVGLTIPLELPPEARSEDRRHKTTSRGHPRCLSSISLLTILEGTRPAQEA